MRKLPVPILVFTTLCGLLLTGSAVADDLAHCHGGFVTTTPDRASKAPEGVLYLAWLRLPPAQTLYFVGGTCEVLDQNGRFMTGGKFKFTRGSVEGDTLEIKTPNVKGRWNTFVLKEVSKMVLLTDEALVAGSNVKLSKRAKAGYDVDCIHAVCEFNKALFANAASEAEREAIVAQLAAHHFGRHRNRE